MARTGRLGLALALCGAVQAAHAQDHAFAYLSGAAEQPPNGSPLFVDVLMSPTFYYDFLSIGVQQTNRPTLITDLALHCCTELPGTGLAPTAWHAPIGGVSPSNGVFTLFYRTRISDWDPSFLGLYGNSTEAAWQALQEGMADGTMYFEAHSAEYPDVRGFVTTALPEPSGWAMLAVGGALLGWRRLRWRQG
jgi:hypothetical protein